MTAPKIDTSRVNLYNEGRTTVFAYPKDPRFSYCLYVPPFDADAPPPGLIVVVHHSMRTVNHSRDLFAELGAQKRQVVLAPLFPANVLGDGNVDGYKYLNEGDIRYDLILNGMIDLVAETTKCDAARFCLFGFSGGGHFVHRYLLTHPERLIAVSIGAPGQVTLLDPQTDWWAGVRDLEKQFGRPLDIDALRRVAVQMIVGDQDTDTREIIHAPGSLYWRAESEKAGKNRIERLRSLQRSFEASGVDVEFDLLPGTDHEFRPAAASAEAFFARKIDQARAAAAGRKS